MAPKTKDFYLNSNLPALCMQLGVISINELLSKWIDAWQHKDHKRYFACDDEVFDELLIRCGDIPDNQ